jgi:hypothetical protein
MISAHMTRRMMRWLIDHSAATLTELWLVAKALDEAGWADLNEGDEHDVIAVFERWPLPAARSGRARTRGRAHRRALRVSDHDRATEREHVHDVADDRVEARGGRP